MRNMREPLITATLFSIYVSTRSTAKAIGALQMGFALRSSGR
jgi:hypothetical protein